MQHTNNIIYGSLQTSSYHHCNQKLDSLHHLSKCTTAVTEFIVWQLTSTRRSVTYVCWMLADKSNNRPDKRCLWSACVHVQLRDVEMWLTPWICCVTARVLSNTRYETCWRDGSHQSLLQVHHNINTFKNILYISSSDTGSDVCKRP